MSFARGNGIENRPCIIHLRSGIYQSWFSSPFLLLYARFLPIYAICFCLIFTSVRSTCRWKITAVSDRAESVCEKNVLMENYPNAVIHNGSLISGRYRWNHITNQMGIQTKMWTVWSITFSTHNRFKFFYLTKENGSNLEYYACLWNISVIKSDAFKHICANSILQAINFSQCNFRSFIIITLKIFVYFFLICTLFFFFISSNMQSK